MTRGIGQVGLLICTHLVTRRTNPGQPSWRSNLVKCGVVQWNVFSLRAGRFQRERAEKGDELLYSQTHKSGKMLLFPRQRYWSWWRGNEWCSERLAVLLQQKLSSWKEILEWEMVVFSPTIPILKVGGLRLKYYKQKVLRLGVNHIV